METCMNWLWFFGGMGIALLIILVIHLASMDDNSGC